MCYPEKSKWLLLVLNVSQIQADSVQFSLPCIRWNVQVQGADGGSSQHYSQSKMSLQVAEQYTKAALVASDLLSCVLFKWLVGTEGLTAWT